MPCQTGTTSRQRHQSPTPETSTDGNPSGTGFRSRLQSAPSECHPTTSALDFRDVPKNVIDQFQADFVFVPSPPPTTTAKLPAAKVSEKTNEAILQLTGECVAFSPTTEG